MISTSLLCPASAIRAFQLDLARHPEEPEEVLRMAGIVAQWGCTHLVLNLEGTIASPACPHPVTTRTYTPHEVARMAEGIAAVGLAVVPVVATLGHAEMFVRIEAWRHVSEDGAGEGRFGVHPQPCTLCPSHPDTLPLLTAHITHVCSLVPGVDLHLGLDEAFHLGMCPRCRARGDLATIWHQHLLALITALAPLGRRLWMWDDALELYPELLDALPRGMLLSHWQYDGQIDASGVQARLVNRWRRDWLTLYHERGIECLACPWVKNPLNVLQFGAYAQRHPATGLLLTSWDATHRLLPTLGLVARTALRIWDGDEPEHAWQETATAIAGDASRLLAALASLSAPLNVYPSPNLLGGTISMEEDAQDRLLRALEPQFEQLPVGDSAAGCDGRLLAWWIRWRLLQLGLRRHLPALVDPRLSLAYRKPHADGARMLTERLGALCAEMSEVFASWSDTVDNRTCLQRLRDEIAAQQTLMTAWCAAPPPALLIIRMRHQDCYGVPSLTVDGEFSSHDLSHQSVWKNLACGSWKPMADGAQLASGHFTVAFPLIEIPRHLRLRGGGLGGTGVSYVEIRSAQGVYFPPAIVDCGGSVTSPEALLRDDSDTCEFGSHGIADIMRRLPAPANEGWVTLLMATPHAHQQQEKGTP